MNPETIPQELRHRHQWITFDVDTEDGRKIPFTPGSDAYASPSEPSTWRSLRTALDDIESGRRKYLGFAFTEDDPFVFIDLDNISDEYQQSVFETFKSYSQRSVSGAGIHVIGRGTFAGPGKHPRSPEIGLFKAKRFCLWTGDVIEGREEIETLDNELLQKLYADLGTTSDYERVKLVELEASKEDAELIELCRDAYPSKFQKLLDGDWYDFNEYHQDHSAADHALISILCDRTESNEQVRRIFSASGMWSDVRRRKKSEGYIDRSIAKMRAKQAEQAKQSSALSWALTTHSQQVVKKPVAAVSTTFNEELIRKQRVGSSKLIDSLPGGLLKDLASYSFNSSYIPLQEASLLTAISLMSGIAGRAFLSDTGCALNVWTILVGDTGTGKDELNKGMIRILSHVADEVPTVFGMMSGEFVSGPAFETALTDRSRIISYVPEFGAYYTKLSQPNAPDHVATLTRTLLAAYTAADAGGRLERRRRAKNEDGVEPFIRPCITICGESTAAKFLDRLSQTDVASGLLQRFLLLQASPESISFEERAFDARVNMPSDVSRRLAALLQVVDQADSSDAPTKLTYAPSAQAQLASYRRDTRINGIFYTGPGGEAAKESMNRAGLKATRLAGLLAVAQDFHSPHVETEHADWAIQFVEACDGNVRRLFAEEGAANPQVRQETLVLKALDKLMAMDPQSRAASGFPDNMLEQTIGIPYSLVKDQVISHEAFAEDKNGSVTAFDRTINGLIADGKIVRVPSDTCRTVIGTLLPCLSRSAALPG